MLLGPVFHREVAIAPRRPRIYVARTAYVAGLLLLSATAWLLLTGTQQIRDVGDLARFGAILFQILAPLQLTLAVFFSAMLAASAVAQEKERKTFVLLMLTDLSNSELVLGKLMASLLLVLVMLVAALPLFMFTALLGGVSFGQIGHTFAITAATVFACGSLGSTLALWREKTFQALALAIVALVFWLALGEIVATGLLGEVFAGVSARNWAIAISPWQAILDVARPRAEAATASIPPTWLFLGTAAGVVLVLNGWAMLMVRRWNRSERWAEPEVGGAKKAISGEGPEARRAATAEAALGRGRRVWDNPILWREVRTWAYGRRILILRLAYLALFALAVGSVAAVVTAGQPLSFSRGAWAVVPLVLLGLVLVNAQAVTALTSERDAKALDLLLVTDLSPKEFVFGKLGGIFYNTKEMILLPMFLCGYLWYARAISLENLAYLLGGMGVLYVFAGMLGLHAGINYENSRSAIATSLGTVFFLFVGVATCMRMMVAFSGSFSAQLQPFLAFMIGGGVGLYVALGSRNPSTAIGVASFLCPFATFYAITSFLVGQTLNVFLVLLAAYGFTTAAMLIPALFEFDVATGRTTAGEG